MNCKHWTSCGVRDGGCCSLGLYGGKPSIGTCAVCPSREGDVPVAFPDGYGTKLEQLIKAKYKVESCGACFHRVAEMNQMTLEEAVAAKRDILEDIWTRRDQTKGLRKLASRLPGAKHLAFYELGKLYDEALTEQA